MLTSGQSVERVPISLTCDLHDCNLKRFDPFMFGKITYAKGDKKKVINS